MEFQHNFWAQGEGEEDGESSGCEEWNDQVEAFGGRGGVTEGRGEWGVQGAGEQA